MPLSSSRHLGYCGIRSLCGPDIADELHGRRLPVGFDCDFPPDQQAATAIAAARERQEAECAACPSRDYCHP
ncbi:MAG: hypothetical protein HQL42_13000 [Alphaproteobacteria bacterium]|nr:hypothetical protein [Alphaproteobacteria bacterium]